jgi:hypothetical protein
MKRTACLVQLGSRCGVLSRSAPRSGKILQYWGQSLCVVSSDQKTLFSAGLPVPCTCELVMTALVCTVLLQLSNYTEQRPS